MVHEWLCPHCGSSFYSSSDFRDQELVECPECGTEVPNPYYKGEK